MHFIKKKQGFLIGVDKKLSNKRFVDNAPDVVLENKKRDDALSKIKTIEESLASLK